MVNRPWPGVFALALLIVAADARAQARAWTISPAIALRGTYTDNVSLAAAPKRGDFVTMVSPSVAVDGRTARFTGNLNYTADAIFYSRNSGNDRLVNTLSAFGRLEAVENSFFIDALGSVTQNYISPFGARPSDIYTTTDNRTETRTFGLSPFVRGQFGGGYTYEVRNRNLWTSADTSQLANAHTRQWTGSLASPIRLFGWSVEAADSRIRYENNIRPDLEERLARARLFYQPDPELRLSLSAGHERNNYNVGQRERSNNIYGYGAQWRPTPRTTVELEWEHRYFGSSRLASFSHRTPLTAWNVAYTRNASTFPQELLRLPPGNTAALLDAIFRARIPDPVERRAAVRQFMFATGIPPFLANSLAFYTEQVFLQESLQGAFAILGARNSITFTAFRSRTRSLTDTLGALPADVFLTANRVKQRGFGASASHQLTPSATVGLSATRTFAETEEPSTLESRNDFISLTLNRTLSPKTTTFGGASYTRFDPSGGPTSHARAVFVGLSHRF